MECWTLDNHNGMTAEILTYGGILRTLTVPSPTGPRDVVLGLDTVADYEANPGPHLGALVGRVAGRISGASFALNGKEYHLTANAPHTCLHGGAKGYAKQVWQAEAVDGKLVLTYFSPDGEEHFPGNLKVRVVYALTADNSLTIEYFAETDGSTIVNLTNHSYFNLNGHDAGTLEQQKVQIFADFYTENSNECLPTGVIAAVEGTPMDFREPHEIMERIDADFVQLKNGSGYDHNWIPNGYQKDMVRKCAEAVGEETGIRMAVYSDQPGVQFYSGNFLDGIVKGKNGAVYGRRSGFCFETQGFPNATAYGHFPSAVLRQGEWFRSQTIFAFSKD